MCESSAAESGSRIQRELVEAGEAERSRKRQRSHGSRDYSAERRENADEDESNRARKQQRSLDRHDAYGDWQEVPSTGEVNGQGHLSGLADDTEEDDDGDIGKKKKKVSIDLLQI